MASFTAAQRGSDTTTFFSSLGLAANEVQARGQVPSEVLRVDTGYEGRAAQRLSFGAPKRFCS